MPNVINTGRRRKSASNFFKSKGLGRPNKERREQRAIELAGRSLNYTLVRSPRRHRKLSLQINLTGAVEVRAPYAASEMDIDAMLRKHRDWLFERQREAARRPGPREWRYCNGERHPFMGEELALKIQRRQGRPRLERCGGELLVHSANTEADALKSLLSSWYTRQAQTVFSERLRYWSSRLDWVESVPPLRLRRMRSRWGSCSREGRLCLNTRLIKADPDCIDTVIVHELCHLQEFNHSKAFYQLMDSVLPGWREHQQRLDEMGVTLLRD
ncbi:M48 family metallopeptidase [Spongiibacter sp. KMU-158]|uniref:M48 family metallopeptidase n=1 Tax=Spongiibacter pelagi TaxID=2760804 RepID=A0A927BYQ8_9GAMM|nr:SprT family zinc-dependent metalloprotease [Spongiibacter pelagi]MBD2858028.1 M48 family metallopeptidase [Spongiibacter pelagi]